ncbi:MAG: hypothetical protein ACOZIN_15510 [Myxococcota bacterium]
MTAEELSYAGLLRVLRDLRRDRESMEQHAQQAEQCRTKLEGKPDTGVATVLALSLHHYYTALETALSRVVRILEGALPPGPDWHVALLAHVAAPLDPLRPALVAPERLPELSQLRRFRHFLRNAYAVSLDASRLLQLANALRAVHPGLIRDLTETQAFLEAVRDRLAGEQS